MRIAIIGGGITGLATAYLAERAGHEVLLYEKEEELGGRSRTIVEHPYRFDYSGHWLWGGTASPDFLSSFAHLHSVKRLAGVLAHGDIVPYPLQNNLAEIVVRPLERDRFARSLLSAQDNPPPKTLDDILRRYGDELYSFFFQEFETRYRRYDPASIPARSVERIPQVGIGEILRGLFLPSSHAVGYNSEFCFANNGIGALVDSIASKLTKTVVLRKTYVSDVVGLVEDFDLVVNTAPLPWLIKQLGFPDPGFRSLTTYSLQVGGVTDVPDWHWLYLGEEFSPAYRIGFYSHVYPGGLYAPDDRSFEHDASMYIDVNVLPDSPFVPDVQGILEPFIASGIIKEVHTTHLVEVPFAYSVDGFVGPSEITLFDFAGMYLDLLDRKGIVSIGDAGKWRGMHATMRSIDDALNLSKIRF